MADRLMTYEESVRWMRSQPELQQMVRDCYLDEDNFSAALRFAASEEFCDIVKFLRLDSAVAEGRKLKILDLGCGNGIASYAFACLWHDVFAVDPDPSNDVGLSAARRLAGLVSKGSLSTFQAFAESLPFGESILDIVYTRQGLHHFSSLEKGLAECRRALAPGGLLFTTREHVVSDQEQLKSFLENHILHRMHGQENAYPLEEYIRALEGSGFKIKRCFGTFDSVINHFPTPNSEVRKWFFEALENRIGKFFAPAIMEIPLAERYYRNRLSRAYNAPGRPYSFLCNV